jgi:predicted nucleotide-binding protein
LFFTYPASVVGQKIRPTTAEIISIIFPTKINCTLKIILYFNAMKIKLFIGSSTESLYIAKELTALLDDEFDITVWDTAFRDGDYILETLYKELFITDFGLFIIAPDDKLFARGAKSYSTRDNVIFELGMFVGALGAKKAYFVIADINKNGKELKIRIPNDLDGINRTRMRLKVSEENQLIQSDSNWAELVKTSASIKKNIKAINEHFSLSLLPSTSLAIGYFENFLLPACKELSAISNFQHNDRTYNMTKDQFQFNIIIPETGGDMGHDAYRKFVRNNNLEQMQIRSRSSPRTFPFFVNTKTNSEKLLLFDLPTTLRASWETIHMVMPKNTTLREIKYLEHKEISNFSRTIMHLLSRPEAGEFRDNIVLTTISEQSKKN